MTDMDKLRQFVEMIARESRCEEDEDWQPEETP